MMRSAKRAPHFVLALACLAGLALPQEAHATCDALFGPAHESFAGPYARYLAAGDFNEDGWVDLAVPVGDAFTAGEPGSGVAILIATGGGGFAPPVTYATGKVASHVVTGDFNEDGITDLAVSHKGSSSSVTILLGKGTAGLGNGTFLIGSFIPVSGRPFGLVTGDFDGDGIADLATCLNNLMGIALLRGQGDGGVGDGTFVQTGTLSLNSISSGLASGDFNNDGRLDLVATEFYMSTLAVVLGTGTAPLANASFTPSAHVPVPDEPFAVAVADVNADGNLDLVVAHTAGHGISVQLGTGTGTFTPGVTIPAGNCSGVTTADFDHDGALDIATGLLTGSNSGYTEIFRGHGDGTFGAAEIVRPGRDSYAVVAGDLDADGTIDLAVSDGYGSNVGVLYGACAPGCPQVAMSLDISPNTFNLRSLGHWVTAVLEPEAPATPADIDVSSIRLNGSVPVDPSAPLSVGDTDDDGRPDLTVKFDRGAVETTVEEGDAVTITVTGSIGAGCFTATDVVRVRRGRVTSPSAGGVLQAGDVAEVRWDSPSGVQVQSVAVLFSEDGGTAWSLVDHELPNTGRFEWTVPSGSTDEARLAIVLVEESLAGEGYDVKGVLGISNAFTIASPLAVPNGGIELALRPAANPCRNLTMSVTLPGGGSATLVAYDISGRECGRRVVNGPGQRDVAIETSERLLPGVYLVHLIQGADRRIARVSVTR